MIKAWQPFSDKIRHLMRHMEIIDASLAVAVSKSRNESDFISIGAALGKPKYSLLNEKNTKSNIDRIIAFSRSKLHERVIIDLYRYFSEFISETIREVAHSNPTIFLNDLNSQKQRDISFAEIIRLGRYTAIIDEMANRVYRGLEKEQSTKKLLTRFIKVCNINIPSDDINKALIYLEVRHLIIHNSGKADVKFKTINVNGTVKLDSSDNIRMNYKLTNRAIKQIYKIALYIKDQIPI